MTNVEQLIREIHAAFEGIELRNGTSLNMCEYHDSGGTDKSRLEMATHDERVDWHKVISDDLIHFGLTFSFTDGDGYRFYLPAYMVWTLQAYKRSMAMADNPEPHDLHDPLATLNWLGKQGSLIHDDAIYAIDADRDSFKQAMFTAQQLDVLERFLEFTCEAEAAGFDSVIAQQNLAKLRAFRNAEKSTSGRNLS